MNKPLEQGIIIYQATIVEQTVPFFPSTLNDWFKLDENIRNSEAIANYLLFVQFKATYTIFLTQKV